MKIKDVVQQWPPVAWAGSYGGRDPLDPDPARALVRSARAKGDGVILAVEDEGRDRSVWLPVEDAQSRDQLANAIDRQRGSKLRDLGEVVV